MFNTIRVILVRAIGRPVKVISYGLMCASKLLLTSFFICTVSHFQTGMETDDRTEEIAKLQAIIASEEEKDKAYKTENKRRRHNYVPFIVELLKLLAKENKLVPLVQQVRTFQNFLHATF